MISSYKSETSSSDVSTNCSDVQNDSKSLSELFDTDYDSFPEVVRVGRLTPESIKQFRERFEMYEKEREESIEWKLESSVRELRRLFEEVFSLYDQRIQFLLERTHQ